MPTLLPSRIYQNAVLDSTRWQAFIPRADDVVISTSYKAGTTWTMAIARELSGNGPSPPMPSQTSHRPFVREPKPFSPRDKWSLARRTHRGGAGDV